MRSLQEDFGAGESASIALSYSIPQSIFASDDGAACNYAIELLGVERIIGLNEILEIIN